MSDHTHNSATTGTSTATVRAVVRLAGMARLLRILGALASLVVLVALCVAGAAAVDAAVRFPAVLRGVILAVIAFAVYVDLRRFVLPALRFRPAPVDIALRIERMRPELAGRLASAVEFELSGTVRGSALAARAVRDAEERAVGAELGRVLRIKPTVLRALAALACVAAIVGFAAVQPSWASIAARRVLAPWTDAVWPARTALAGLVVDGSVAARGRPFALRAQLTQGEASRERVRAEYRFTRDGVAGEWIEIALARQPSGAFERVVDAEGERLEVRFLTSDASTDVATVRLVPPPAVAAATVRIEPPAYVADVLAAREVDLGDGGDSRGILRDPVLEGSAVRLDLRLSREVPAGASSAVMIASAAAPPGDGAADGAGARAMDVIVDPADPTRWSVACTADAPTRITVRLVDADGIEADDEMVFAFDTVADRAPTATVAEPLQDESVVADARIPMRAESRDDLALVKAGIEIATRIGKDGAESLVFEEPAAMGDGVAAGARTEATSERVLDLARLALSAGDSVVLRGYAEDALASHGRVRSAPRILRIVGEEEFERQIRGVFAGVRRDAMRVDERQGKARDALERDPAERGVNEMQAAVTDGANRMREAIEQAMDRLERNGREGGVLSELAEQARELAGTAESRSAEASAALEQAQAEGDPARRAEATKEAAERQEAVREELEDLVSLLDRDQDAWVARRRLEALANRIRQSARETDQAARRSNGETREQLSPDARAEIDALADRQQQAADEAEQVAQALRDRAQELAEADPQQAKALEQAAQAMEDGKVREEMEQASRDAGRNRLAQSKEAQDRAADALQKAGQALEEDRKVRAEELARDLESLADSIRRLIEQAEEVRAEVDAIGAGDDDDDAAQAERERAALGAGKLSQNTRGVAVDARASGREAARVARTLDGAAASLGKVAGNLRAPRYDANDTGLAVEAALKQLNDALDEAEEAAERAEQRAETEKREELLAKYRDFLEREAAIRASTERIRPTDGRPLARRELIESRRLGVVQEELRAAIELLRTSEADVQASDALVEMHDAIDAALTDAKERLGEGKPADALAPVSDAIDAIAAIVAALDEENQKQDDDPFGDDAQGQDGQQGGEGQGESGGTVPPAAEIKLLRAMQESLAKRTRTLAEQADGLDAVARAQAIAELAARQERILELATKIADKIRPPTGGPEMRPDAPAPEGQPDSGGSDGEKPQSEGDQP